MNRINIFNKKLFNTYNLIKENIYSCVIESAKVNDKKFHHRLDIRDVTSVLKYGLLSRKLKAEFVDGRNLTEREISIFSEDWHVNGIDYISLSNGEEDFIDGASLNSYSGYFPDIIVSSKVDAIKNSSNYINEYLVKNYISTELFNSIDFRIFNIVKSSNLSNRKKINLLLQYYEDIKIIATYLVENNISIPIRETSEVTNKDEYYRAITLDPYKIMALPSLKQKPILK